MGTLVFVFVFAPAGAVLAHNGTGGASSDYRIEIVGYDGDPSGFTLRVVELGNRLELHRTTAQTISILGYSGEPYLRLDAAGVAENTNSPAHYLNLDRFASTNPPASASATATPAWMTISTGTTVRWHDHRAHWMSTTPRADVLADPDEQRVIFDANRIELVVDGRPVAALIRVTWLPTPHKVWWLGAAALAGLGVAAVFVLVRGAARFIPAAALVAAVGAVLGQGASGTRQLLGIAVIAVAVVGVMLRNRWVALASAVGAGLLAATRIEAFEHALLASWVPAVAQRWALAVAIALCLGVVASMVVGALEPTAPQKAAPA
jgi:hypothetical protein